MENKTITCRRCRTNNNNNAKFCYNCGYPINTTGKNYCPWCFIYTDEYFCPRCGASIIYRGTKIKVEGHNSNEVKEVSEHILKQVIRKTNKNMKINNPWISGSFYLILAIIIIIGLAVLSHLVHWTLFPIIIIAGILFIGLVGILQLKNDDKISDKSFVSLIVETYKRLPLIGNKKQK
jgi:hypothetical protein